jgi:hypothetical protein
MLTLLLGKQRNLILRRLALFTKYIYFKEENNNYFYFSELSNSAIKSYIPYIDSFSVKIKYNLNNLLSFLEKEQPKILFLQEIENLFTDEKKELYNICKQIGYLSKKIKIYASTDSEYIVSGFNNLIYANLLNCPEGDKIIDKKYWIRDIKAYKFESCGKKINIIDTETGLINFDLFYDYMKEIQDEFDDLYEFDNILSVNLATEGKQC